MRRRTLTLSTDSVRRSPPPAPSWWPPSIARAFPWSSRAAHNPTPRLTKGQKANKKRMATVAAVFTRAPWVRTPQQVVESLFRISRPTPEDAPVPPRPENKRVWASLLKGKTAVIQEVAEEMDRRDPSRIQNPRGLDRRRASATDSSRPKAESHPDSGPDARSGETLESRLCLPCRGQPGSRTLGPGPHSANPAR